MKIQNMSTMSSMITSLVLIFSFQVLAGEVEIQGWDKAKFGMSPEQLRNVYAEEEEYFKPDAFWEEKEEDKFSHIPYTLFTSRLEMLGYWGGITFLFVNDKLFKIIMTGGEERITFGLDGLLPWWEAGKLRGIMTSEERKKKMMETLEKIKLRREEGKITPGDWETSLIERRIIDVMKEEEPIEFLIEFLTNKYGEPSIVEQNVGTIHKWNDKKDNILLLREYVPLSVDSTPGIRVYLFIMTYTSEELINLWTAKVDEWEKERKRIIQKNIEIF